jgi:hypothetical protein
MRRTVVSLVGLLLLPVAAQATPITLNITGTMPALAGSADLTGSPVAVGDTFIATVTYDAFAPLTGPAPDVDTYANAMLAMSATFFTSSGPLTYTADHSLFPATVVNFAAVRSTDVFFEVVDYDFDGSHPPVVGPNAIRSIPGFANGQPLTYVPWFLALEIDGDFSAFLTSNALPTGPFTNSPLVRLSVGFASPVIGNTINEVLYEGTGAITSASVPEPASMLLLGTGLAAVARRRFKRRT